MSHDVVFYVGSDIVDFSVISAVFSKLVYKVELHFAATATQFFSYLNSPSRLPALVFLEAPQNDGALDEVVNQLKAHPTGRWIPFVLIGKVRRSSRGACACLERPLEFTAVQRLLANSDLLQIGCTAYD